MKNKGLIVATLGLGLCATCALSLVAVYSTARVVGDNVTGETGLLRMIERADASAEITDVASYEVTVPATLRIDSDAGDVTVRGSNVGQIQVETTRRGWGSTDVEALEVARGLTVAVQTGPDSVSMEFRRPESATWMAGGGQGGTVTFVVTVPLRTSVELATRLGDVTVAASQGDSVVRSDFGDVVVEATKGGTDIRTEAGEIRLEGVDAGGDDVSAETQFGEIRVAEIRARTITLASGSGDVTVETGRAADDVSAETQFGEVRVVGLLAVFYGLGSSSGGLTLRGARGPVSMRTEFGDITLTDAARAVLALRSGSGRVTFSGSLDPDEVHTVTTTFGDIELAIPSDSAFDVEIRTDYGAIESEIPITLAGDVDDRTWEGEMNGGGPLLTIETRNGDIDITAYDDERRAR